MLSRSIRIAFRSLPRLSNSTFRTIPPRSFPVNLQTLRYNSTKDATLKVDPQLMIAFTCKKCDTRSSHTFSKQAYQTGSVLIQCPGCKNRHLIADNLKIFSDDNFDLEAVLKAKGESVATDTNDLAFEDIPDSLKASIGHHAKDAPEVEEEIRGLSDKK